tara:strand:+ start:530 stop:1240 length:711 start_codon:yes stop_codon:yes gene_type:complete
MAKIAPTTITLDPTQTLTLNLKPNPELSSQTVALVALADRVAVTSFADSVEASAFLARVQHLRRWVTGIYKDAKGPLTVAKRTLDAQEKALLVPLAEAEQRVMGLIVAFTAAQAAAQAAREAAALTQHLAGAPVEITAPAPVAVIDGMQSRTTYSATVTDVRALVLAVAGQLLLETPGATKVTQGWLRRVCAPTPQCTLALLEPAAPALNALARALRTDLAVPGTTLASITTLVAR